MSELRDALLQPLASAEHELLKTAADPGGVLPSVKFQLSIEDTWSNFDQYNIIVGDYGDVGYFVIKQNKSTRVQRFMDIEIEDTFYGRGIGTSTYLRVAAAVISLHEDSIFRSDERCLYPQSVAVWRRLVDAGVAESIAPFVKSPTNDGDLYFGHAQITNRTVVEASQSPRL